MSCWRAAAWAEAAAAEEVGAADVAAEVLLEPAEEAHREAAVGHHEAEEGLPIVVAVAARGRPSAIRLR